MNRLESELQRLYAPRSPAPADATRALVMEVVGPGAWAALAPVWRGVQAELELPAPAVAVSGTDGLQLWFSLQDAVGSAPARHALALLQARYLPAEWHAQPAGRVRLFPPAEGAGPGCEAPRAPTQVAATGHWSAVVAPDLAPIFSDTPWLDVEPSAEGQADLLARLQSITPAAWASALQRLEPGPAVAAPVPAVAAPAAGGLDPRHFLQQVLNDPTVALALRIEAAKALLKPH